MKIPKEAKRVFKGVIFDVYQWQQKMFDSSYETFEALKRSNTIEIIATSGDKILLSHQSQPNKENFYSLLGGRGEEGEEPLETAKRELLEEAGLVSDDWEFRAVYDPFYKIDWNIYSFIARNCKKVQDQELDPGEKIEVIEKSFEEFLDIVLSDSYWGNELVIDILKMKFNNRLEQFKKKLFSRKII